MALATLAVSFTIGEEQASESAWALLDCQLFVSKKIQAQFVLMVEAVFGDIGAKGTT